MHRSGIDNLLIFIAFITGCGFAYQGLIWTINPLWLLVLVPLFWLIYQDIWPSIFSQIIYAVFFITLSGFLGNYFMGLHTADNDPDLTYESLMIQGPIRDVKIKKGRTTCVMRRPTITYPDGTIKKLQRNLRLSCQDSLSELYTGLVLEVCAQLRGIKPPLVKNAFNFQLYNKRQNIYQQGYFEKSDTKILYSPKYMHLAKSLHYWALDRLNYKSVSRQSRAITSAMLIGNRNALDEDTILAFNESGALHILSISGLHVSLVFVIILVLFKHLFPPRRWLTIASQLAAVVFIWIFAAISGMDSPVIRAALMLTLVTMGRWFYRHGPGLNVLIMVCWIMILIDPFVIFQISFQFTALAMWGLISFYPPLSGLIPNIKSRILQQAWSLIAASLAAQLSILPLLTYYFDQVSIYFWLSSLVAVPITPLLLISGLLIIIWPQSILLGQATDWLSHLMLEWLKFCADLPLAVINQFKFSSLQVFTWLGLLVLLTIVLLQWKKMIGLAVTCCVLIFLSVTSASLIKDHSPKVIVEYEQGQTKVTLTYREERYFLDRTTGLLTKKDPSSNAMITLPEPFQNQWLYKNGAYCQVNNKKLCLFPAFSDRMPRREVDVLIHDFALDESITAKQHVFTYTKSSVAATNSWSLLQQGYKVIEL